MAARYVGEGQPLACFHGFDQLSDLAQPLRVSLERNQRAIQI